MSTAVVISCGALVAGIVLLIVGFAARGRRTPRGGGARLATGTPPPGATPLPDAGVAQPAVIVDTASAAVAGAGLRGAAAPGPPLVGRMRVLVIDDDPMIGRMIARLLHGHDTLAVTSGQAALTTLALDDKFDAILCDMMMPGLSGTKLAGVISERHRSLQQRIIFMSATADAERLLYRTELRWIAKPVRYATLALSITEAIATAKAADAERPAELRAAAT